MFRATVRSSRLQPVARQVVAKRFASTEYGPAQDLFSKKHVAAAVVTTGFIGLVWYEKFYAKGKTSKSSIGDWLIPDSNSEAVAAREEEMTLKALKRRQEMQILFSADNTSINLEENIRPSPVPVPEGKAQRPGQTMDLSQIDERRPRTVYFKKLDDKE